MSTIKDLIKIVFIFIFITLVNVSCSSSSNNETSSAPVENYTGIAELDVPISDANADIIEYLTGNTIYSTSTDSQGNFSIPKTYLSSDKLYIIKVKKIYTTSQEITDNQNSNVNEFFALYSPKYNEISVTFLSDFIYRILESTINDKQLSIPDLLTALDNLSRVLIKEDINGDGIISYADALSFRFNRDIIKFSFYDSQRFSDLLNEYKNNLTVKTAISDITYGLLSSDMDTNSVVNVSKVKLTVNQTGNGQIIINNETINSPSFESFFDLNEEVNIKIVPDENTKILDINGCDKFDSNTSTCIVKMTSNKNIDIIYGKNIVLADNVIDITNTSISWNTKIENDKNLLTLSVDCNNNEDKTLIENLIPGQVVIYNGVSEFLAAKIVSIQQLPSSEVCTYEIEYTYPEPHEVIKEGTIYTNTFLVPQELQDVSAGSVVETQGLNGDKVYLIKTKDTDTKGYFYIISLKKDTNISKQEIFTFLDRNLASERLDFQNGFVSAVLKVRMGVDTVIDVGLGFTGLKIKSLRFAPWLNIEPKFTAEISGESNASQKRDIKTFRNLCANLGYGFKACVPMTIGIGGDANAQGKISGNADANLYIKVGFNYTNGQASTIKDYGKTFNGSISAEAAARLFGYIYAKPQPSLDWLSIHLLQGSFYSKLGPELKADAKVSASVNDENTNCQDALLLSLNILFAIEEFEMDFIGTDEFETLSYIRDKINNKLSQLSFAWTYPVYSREISLLDSCESPAKLVVVPPTERYFEVNEGTPFELDTSINIKNEGDMDLIWNYEIRDSDLKIEILNPNIDKIIPPGESRTLSLKLSAQNADAIDRDIINKSYIRIYKTDTYSTLALNTQAQNQTNSNSLPESYLVDFTLKIKNNNIKPVIEQVKQEGKNVKISYTLPEGSANDFDNFRIAVYPANGSDCSTISRGVISNVSKTTRNFIIDMEGAGFTSGGDYCVAVATVSGDDISEYTTQLFKFFKGSISSVVKDIETGQPIAGATLTISPFNQIAYTDANGYYKFDYLPPATYTIEIHATGYLPYRANVSIGENENKSFEALLTLQESSQDQIGTLTGVVRDAQSTTGIPNATISFIEGQNNVNGTPVQQVTTDSEGRYSIQLPAGVYTGIVSADGYISSSFTFAVVPNETTNQDVSLSKEITEVRIVLTWGSSPSDLDSHLVKVSADGNLEYHVYWSNENPTNEAWLDVDDTTSYGPETITIENLDTTATYRYYVHDYTNREETSSTALASSGATVKVYFNGETYTFYPPSSGGTLWKVFEIVNGEIVPCYNCMYYVSSSDSVGSQSITLEKILFRNIPNKN